MKALLSAVLFAAGSIVIAVPALAVTDGETPAITALAPGPPEREKPPATTESSTDSGVSGVVARESIAPDTQVPSAGSFRLVKSYPRGQTYAWGHIMPFGMHNNNYRNGFSVLPPLIVKDGGWPTGSLRIASTFPFFGQSVFLEVESDQIAVHHRTRAVGVPGATPTIVDAGYYREGVVEARGGVRLPHSPVYFGVATYYRSLPGAGSETDPDLVGVGIGLETFPNLWKKSSPYARIYYYPKIETEEPFVNPRTNVPMFLHYSRLIYESGYAVRLGRGNMFAKAAISGDVRRRLNQAPPESPQTSHCLHVRFGPAIRF